MSISEEIASGANEVMDNASSEKKDAAEKVVKKELEQVPETARIIGERHYVFKEDTAKGYELNSANIDEGDQLISKIENAAFKHQLYRVGDNYTAMYPFEQEIDEDGNKKESYIIKRT